MRAAATFVWEPEAPAPLGREGVARLRARAARALAAAADRLGVANLPLVASELGAPVAPDGWQVSLTHTRGLAAAVLARDPVGIDAERTDRDLSAARASASPAELALLAPLVRDEAARVALLWSAREAVLKRMQLGLSGMSRARLVDVVDEGELRFHADDEPVRVFVRRLGVHWLTLAADDPVETVAAAFTEVPA